MKDLKVKKELLDELISKMDEAMVGDLKAKKGMPSMAKVEIEANDPELAEELKSKLIGKEESEMPEAIEEDESEYEAESEDGESDEEDLERLMALYKKLK